MPINNFQTFIAPFDHVIRKLSTANIVLEYQVCTGHSGLYVVRVSFDDQDKADTFVNDIYHSKYKLGSKTNSNTAKAVQTYGGKPCVFFEKDEIIKLLKMSMNIANESDYSLFILSTGDIHRATANYYFGSGFTSVSSATGSFAAKCYYNIPHASKFKNTPILPAEQAVMDLIKAHNAVVRVVGSNYSVNNQTVTYHNKDLDWNLEQIADPNDVAKRPSRYKKYKSSLVSGSFVDKVNPRTGVVTSFQVGQGRQRAHKGATYVDKHTKKHPTTILSPEPAKQYLYDNINTVLLWDINDCNRKGGRYQWKQNAITMNCWWLDSNAVTYKACSKSDIRQHNLTGTITHPVTHNEVLYGYPAKKMTAHGARYVKTDTFHEAGMNDRINTLRVMYYSKQVVGLTDDVPVVCLQTKFQHHLYQPIQRISDVNDALERPASHAYALLSRNNFELLGRIIDNSLFRLPANHAETTRLVKNCENLKIKIAEFNKIEIEAGDFTDPIKSEAILTEFYTYERMAEFLQRGEELFSVPLFAHLLSTLWGYTSYSWNKAASNRVILSWLLKHKEYLLAVDFIQKTNCQLGDTELSMEQERYDNIAAVYQSPQLSVSKRFKLCQFIYFGKSSTRLELDKIIKLIEDKRLSPSLREDMIADLFIYQPLEIRASMLAELVKSNDFNFFEGLIISLNQQQLSPEQMRDLYQPTIAVLLNNSDEVQLQAAVKCELIFKHISAHQAALQIENQLLLKHLKRRSLDIAKVAYQESDPLIHLAILDHDESLAIKLFKEIVATSVNDVQIASACKLAIQTDQLDFAVQLIALAGEGAQFNLFEELTVPLITHLQTSRPALLHDLVLNDEYPLFKLLCINRSPNLVVRFYELAHLTNGKDIFDLCLGKNDKPYIKASMPLMSYLSDEEKNGLFAKLVFAGHIDEAANLFVQIKTLTANYIVNDLGRNIFHYLIANSDLLARVLAKNAQTSAQRDVDNKSPMHLALGQHNLAVCKLLFTHGRQHLDESSLSQLLSLAAKERDYDLCLEILQQPFDASTGLDHKDESGNNCLHSIIYSLYSDRRMMWEVSDLVTEILRRSPKLLTEENVRGLTPIELALDSMSIGDFYKRELLRAINPLHTNVNTATRILFKLRAHTQLFDAALDLLNLMHIDVNQRNTLGNTLLHCYVNSPDTVEIVRALCKMGANPLLKMPSVNTAFFDALSHINSPLGVNPNFLAILKTLCQYLPNNLTRSELPPVPNEFWTYVDNFNILQRAIDDLDVAFVRWLCLMSDGPRISHVIEYAVTQTQQQPACLSVLMTMLQLNTDIITPACAGSSGQLLGAHGISIVQVNAINTGSVASKTALMIRYSDVRIKALQDIPSILEFMTQMKNVFSGAQAPTTTMLGFWQQHALTRLGKHILKIAKNQMLTLIDANPNCVTPATRNEIESLLALSTGVSKHNTTSMSIYRLFGHHSPHKQHKGQVQLQQQIAKHDSWINQHFS